MHGLAQLSSKAAQPRQEPVPCTCHIPVLTVACTCLHLTFKLDCLTSMSASAVYTSSVGAEFTVAAVFLSLWPILEEVTKYAEKEQKETSGSTQ